MRIHPFFKNRYIPNIEWSGGKLITHDVFRLFERIFGREFGIRAEAASSSAFIGKQMATRMEFFTVEALLVFTECRIREFLKSFEFGFEFVELPVFQLAGLFPQQNESLRIPIFKFAIATASTANSFTAAGTTCSVSLTTSGSDRAVIGAVWTWNASNTYTSSTYAGVTATELVNRAADGSGSFIRLVGVHNATTGANNFVSNTSSNMQHFVSCASYSGVASASASAAFPDTETSGTSSGVTSVTMNMTTSVANSWVFAHGRTTSRDMVAGTNTFERVQNATSGDSCNLFDSNGARSSGSNDLQYTWTTSQTTYWCMGSMSPVTSTSVTVSAGVNSATFSVPTYTAKTSVTLVRSTLSAIFSIPVYTIVSGSMTYTASVLSATFSVVAYTAKAGAGVVANTLSATFSVITYAIGLGSRILQATLSATFTTAVLAKVGAVWTKIARNSTGSWTRSNRNND